MLLLLRLLLVLLLLVLFLLLLVLWCFFCFSFSPASTPSCNSTSSTSCISTSSAVFIPPAFLVCHASSFASTSAFDFDPSSTSTSTCTSTFPSASVLDSFLLLAFLSCYDGYLDFAPAAAAAKAPAVTKTKYYWYARMSAPAAISVAVIIIFASEILGRSGLSWQVDVSGETIWMQNMLERSAPTLILVLRGFQNCEPRRDSIVGHACAEFA